MINHIKMQKFKLKDDVTEIQLIKAGFEIRDCPKRGWLSAFRFTKEPVEDPKHHIYISLSEKLSKALDAPAPYRHVVFSITPNDDPIEPYIQDLIDGGLVEEVEDNA